MTASMEDVIKDIKEGKFIIIVDDEQRENEGDLVIAAEKINAEKINFMITHGKGLVCVPMLKKKLDELEIPLMIDVNTEITKCAFTVSVDHKDVSTGISAFDRALTINKLIDKNSKKEDFLKPGHMFPLRYEEGGVLKRRGHTEAAVDAVKLAGLYPAAVICEIINDDGTMARIEDLEKFSERFGLEIVRIKDLVGYMKDLNT